MTHAILSGKASTCGQNRSPIPQPAPQHDSAVPRCLTAVIVQPHDCQHALKAAVPQAGWCVPRTPEAALPDHTAPSLRLRLTSMLDVGRSMFDVHAVNSGFRLCHSVACSYACATFRIVSSPNGLPMICRPMGSGLAARGKPHGIETPQTPLIAPPLLRCIGGTLRCILP